MDGLFTRTTRYAQLLLPSMTSVSVRPLRSSPSRWLAAVVRRRQRAPRGSTASLLVLSMDLILLLAEQCDDLRSLHALTCCSRALHGTLRVALPRLADRLVVCPVGALQTDPKGDFPPGVTVVGAANDPLGHQMCFAVRRNDWSGVQLALAKGAQINGFYGDRRNRKWSSALGFACVYGHANLVWQLVQAGASVNALDSDGLRPLHRCAYKDVHWRLGTSQKPLQVKQPTAAERARCTQLLLRAGADPSLRRMVKLSPSGGVPEFPTAECTWHEAETPVTSPPSPTERPARSATSLPLRTSP